jgi:transposase
VDSNTYPLAEAPPATEPLCPRPACCQARWSANFYRTLHQRATQREALLKQQLAHCHTDWRARLEQREAHLQQRLDDLQAEVRLLKQRLYGRSCEGHHDPNTLAGNAAHTATSAAEPTRRRRGQQRGTPGHGRRRHDHLPASSETAELPPEQRCCSTCGLPFAPCGSAAQVTTLLEVTVRAHRRVIRRRRYRPVCACGTHADLLTAPAPARLLPHSALGVSIWVAVLLDKYAFHRPTYRLLADWRQHGLDLPLGTLTEGLQRLLPLLEPVYQALQAHVRQQQHWHSDDTRWQVFATVEGKVGYQWYLWLLLSAEAAVFVLAAGRAHDVPETTLGTEAQGICNTDRYAAYPAMQQVKDGHIVLALCWAHQRRDFIEAERGRPQLHGWASAWLERIAHLYRLNAARLRVWQRDALAFAAAQQHLHEAVAAMAATAQREQAQRDLAPACRKVLASMSTHWAGLTVFVDHPEVPMDNNAAERAERGPVVGRKNYYGSGAVWAGQLAAIMFSVVQTLAQWQLNARSWLTGYLTACAEQGGQAPPELRRWLPWSMTVAERAALRLVRAGEMGPHPAPHPDTS